MSNELTFYDRQMLQYWLRGKRSIRSIAKIMRRDVSVLSREIKRNSSGRNKYRANLVQRMCAKKKRKQHRNKLDKYPQLKQYVENRLSEDWVMSNFRRRLVLLLLI